MTKTTPKILVFAGSARRDSFNKKLAQAAAQIAETKACGVTLVDLADYVAPVYNGDDEADGGIPKTMLAFKALMKEHDAFLIASPEYNGFVPPLLINIFSWCSRPEEGDTMLVATRGKHIGLMATSPGGLGGIRMLPRLREALADLGAITLPGMVSVGSAMKAFDDEGQIVDEQTKARIEALIDTVIDAASKS
jgi:NAD(P)H-dependent FMN reductase